MNLWIRPNISISTLIMKLTIEYKRPNEKKFGTFMGVQNLTADICKVQAGGASSIFLDIFRKDLQAHSNIFHACPFEVTRVFHSHNFDIKLIDWLLLCFRDMHTCETSF